MNCLKCGEDGVRQAFVCSYRSLLSESRETLGLGPNELFVVVVSQAQKVRGGCSRANSTVAAAVLTMPQEGKGDCLEEPRSRRRAEAFVEMLRWKRKTLRVGVYRSTLISAKLEPTVGAGSGASLTSPV